MSRRVRGWVWAFGLLTATLAHAGITSDRLLTAIVKETPDITVVAAGSEMLRAEAAAAKIPGALVLRGLGQSMAPLFAERTALVIAPVSYQALCKGMTVVYTNSHGRRVAHALKGDLPHAWIAQGVGNDTEDEDLVTAANLVGVVVGAYADAPSEFRAALTRDLAAKGRLIVVANTRR
ncbi:MAG: hypothetical protein V4773_01800 [Verrucomicrobiota bacterium]